jgi:hypothetical protein
MFIIAVVLVTTLPDALKMPSLTRCSAKVVCVDDEFLGHVMPAIAYPLQDVRLVGHERVDACRYHPAHVGFFVHRPGIDFLAAPMPSPNGRRIDQ